MPQEPSPDTLIAMRRGVPFRSAAACRAALSLRAVSRMMGRRRVDGGGPWGTAGPPACFWHGVLRPPEEKAGRPEEAGTLPGMFDEERRSGRCPPRKAISD